MLMILTKQYSPLVTKKHKQHPNRRVWQLWGIGMWVWRREFYRAFRFAFRSQSFIWYLMGIMCGSLIMQFLPLLGGDGGSRGICKGIKT